MKSISERMSEVVPPAEVHNMQKELLDDTQLLLENCKYAADSSLN